MVKIIVENTRLTAPIACPLCREKYGNTNGKYQELGFNFLLNRLRKG
jgi:hypothetical protein